MNNIPKHVVVLGAGPAGLSTAWELSKAGVGVDVLEMESQVGGLCRSTKRDGFIFDLGGHRFVTKDNLVLSQIQELMGDELLLRTRHSAIWIQGRFFAYPLELFDILKKAHHLVLIKTLKDFFLARLGIYSKIQDISLQDWILKRFGPTMYNIYFGPYSHKLWGLPPEQISADWATQRISLVNSTDVILRALGKRKDMPKTYARHFLYPKKVIGRICEQMADEIKKRGGEIHLNAKVTKIELRHKKIDNVAYAQNEEGKTISGDFVVSTIPLSEFILNVEPKLEDKYIDIAESMHFRCIKLVHLMLDVEHISNNTWIYTPEEKCIFFRIQDRRNWSPTVVPEGKNALTLEIACNKNDFVWNAPDEEIFKRCIKDLEDMKLVTKNTVTDYFIEKVEYAYPVYSLDYQKKSKIMYSFLSQIKDFISIGRQGLYRYNNMDHSLKMGILTARHMLHSYPQEKIFGIATENVVFD